MPNKQNKSDHECVIGLLRRQCRQTLVTLPQLKRYVAEDAYVLEQVKRFPDMRYTEITLPRGYTSRDYCNRQLKTGLKYFEFCPECGKRIDWRLIKHFG